MVAVVSGGGLGLFDTSFARLGFSLGGNAGLGQGRLTDYVNVATGNLLLQQQDDVFVSHDWAQSFVRTYNSQGNTVFSGADGWFGDFETTLVFHHGGKNSDTGSSDNSAGHGTTQGPGLSITRVGRDGSETLYTLDPTDPTQTRYVSTDGAGAHDWLKFNEDTQRWIWTEGSSRRQMQYDIHGRLLEVLDTKSGASFTVHREPVDKKHDRIASIENEAGEAVVFGYNAAGQLATLSLQANGETTQEVSYVYDRLGRLTETSVDLSPGAADSGVYTTRYSYDGDSLRIAEVTQSDGTHLSFTYVEVNGSWRVKTATTGAGDAAATLRFDYHPELDQTDIVDGLGRTWSYVYGDDGQLREVLSPPVDGRRLVTEYRYDDDGNLLSVTDARGNTVAYTYDDQGNELTQVDSLGNTVTRTYTAANQLATETVYRAADPDGEGAGVPADPETTRYIYDAANRLRYIVSAAGSVVQNEYGTSGPADGLVVSRRTYLHARYDVAGLASDDALTESQLNVWVAAQDQSGVSRVDYAYDFRGQLASETAYSRVDDTGTGVMDSGAQITRYVYDAHGLMRQSIVLRGIDRADVEVTSYVHDGLGRLIATTDAASNTTTRVYDGAGQRLVVTQANGLVTTTVHDAAGRTVAVVAGGGDAPEHASHYYYDAAGQLRAVEDATGALSYTFYDAAGRVAGVVDATGAVVEYAYNADGQRTKGHQYSTRVNTSNWLQDGAVVPASLDAIRPNTTADDRVTTRTYDSAGRLATETNAAGLITTYTYDGASNLLKKQRGERVTRYFYDDDSRQIAVLDSGNYLTETVRDAAGRVVKTIAYASRSESGIAATLAALRPVPDAAHDQVTRYFYDGRGQRIGELDAGGYLTEWVYDEAGHQRLQTRYATRLTDLDGNETLPVLRARVAEGDRHVTQTAYDAMGRVSVVVNSEGMVTRYEYDEVGHLIHTRTDDDVSEVRDDYRRYDVFGNLIGELSGEGAAHYRSEMSETELDALYASFGTRYSYDAAGRRTQSIDANGNKVWFMYDADGRLTHTVRGVADEQGDQNALGEVTETIYNAFGQAAETLQYAGHIDTTDLDNLAAAIRSILNPNRDAHSVYRYDTRGLLLSRTAAQTATEAGVTSYAYNAYGERTDVTVQIEGDRSVTTHTDHNARGLVTDIFRDYGGLNLLTHRDYDAFGRVVAQTDARGQETTFTYDRLGRQVVRMQSVSGHVESRSTTYDAYGRTLTQTDALGQVTTYSYDDVERSVTVTSPEGIKVTTWRNGYGQVLKLEDGAGTVTTHSYDRNGRLVETSLADADGNPLELLAEYGYDAVGNRKFSVDANGHRTDYSWDAAGRLLARTDAEGETTLYEYDGRGQRIRTTDARGVVTETFFDAKGEVVRVVTDAAENGLQLETAYTYDHRGRRLTVTEGSGTADALTTQYVYDKLGRRTAAIVNPDGLALTTRYAYDANDNLIRRTEGANTSDARTTLYAYDEANRQIFEVGPSGAVTRTFYDRDGHVTATTRYAATLNAGTLGETWSVAEIDDAVSADAARDQTTYRVLDADGRARFIVGPDGAVISHSYNGNGNVLETIQYARPLELTAAQRSLLRTGGSAVVGDVADWVDSATADRHTATVYDARGRARFVLHQIGSQAEVAETRYDAVGNVVAKLSFGAHIRYAANLSVSQVAEKLSGEAHRDTRYIYDSVDRLRFTIDALNHVSEQRYDAVGNVVEKLAYAASFDPEAGAADWAQSHENDAGTRRTQYSYDAAGRLSTVTDGLGFSETYSYTAAGLKQSWTNKNGDTWNYKYDAAGRLTDTISPKIRMGYWSGGELKTRTASVTTHITYDAFGNVTSRTEAYGTSDARTTSYGYDAAGHQTTTRRGSLRTQVVYDVFGNAVASRDESGYYHYKVYDNNNRLRYDIDAMGYVTAYTYDAFGDRTGTTRYASALDLDGQGLTTLTAARVENRLDVDAGHDRSLTVRFDDLGRKIAVTQEYVSDNYDADSAKSYSGRPETRFTYNAYGEVATESVRIDGDTWAVTHHYYDALGRKQMDVDAMGYVTAWRYTGTGEMAQTVEYARAIETDNLSLTDAPDAPEAGGVETGYDRVTTYTYDKVGRQQSITLNRHYQDHGGHTLIGGLSTTKTYDGVGNVIRVSRNGQATNTYYDALGHTVRTMAPRRAVLATDAPGQLAGGLGSSTIKTSIAPESDYIVNAFGQILKTTRDSGTTITEDRVTYNRYDALGRLIKQEDAEGNVSHREYDDAGHLTVEWHEQHDSDGDSWRVQTRNRYDANGHLIRTTLTRSRGRTTNTETDTQLHYNAFGELIARGSAGASRPEVYFHYDRAGRLAETNSGDGVAKRYKYNLAGAKTRLAAGDSSSYVTTLYHVDLNGRATFIELPPFVRNHAKPHVERELDRWGDVIAQTDQRGFTTRYTYNEAGQRTSTITPMTRVVGADGRGQWLHPVERYFYDLFGRRIGVEDANGHISQRYYDSAGNLVRSENAVGDTTLYAYNAFGDQLAVQNADGYVTTKTYDKNGRVVATGDVHGTDDLSWVAGELQSYELNEAGDRLSVTDALGNTRTYDYDSRHHVIASESAMGVPHRYAYDALGNRIEAGDGWYSQTWSYDYFGHVQSHTDRGLNEHGYTYKDGRLIEETSNAPRSGNGGSDGIIMGDGSDENGFAPGRPSLQADEQISELKSELQKDDGDPFPDYPPPGDEDDPPPPPTQTRTYKYYANGLLKEIRETGTDNVYKFQYDAAGNRTVEDSLTWDGRGNKIHVRTKIFYDSHNRIARVLSQDRVTGRYTLDVRYEYDAAGNRRHVVVQSGYGENATAIDSSLLKPTAVDPGATWYLRAGRTFHFEIPAAELFQDPQGDPLQYGRIDTPSWMDISYDARDNVFVVTGRTPGGNRSADVAITANNDVGSTSTTITFVVSAAGTDAAGTGPSRRASIPDLVLRPGQALNVTLAATDYFDTPYVGDTLSLSASVDNAPGWLDVSVEGGTLRLSGKPGANVGEGQWTITVTARDDAGEAVSDTFTLYLREAKAPDVDQTIPDQMATAGELYDLSRRVDAVFSDVGDPTDAYGAGLSLGLHLTSGDPLPAWLHFTIDPNNGKPIFHLTGTPPVDVEAADYALELVATAASGKSASVAFTLHLGAHEPPTVKREVGQQVWPIHIDNHLTLKASSYFGSPYGDQLTYSLLDGAPDWVEFRYSDGRLYLSGEPMSGDDRGDYTLKIQATDSYGFSSVLEVPVHVKYDAAPVMHNGGLPDALQATEGESFSYTIPEGAFTDPDGNPLVYSFEYYKLIPVGGFPSYKIQDLLTYNYPNGFYDQANEVIVDLETSPRWLHFNERTRTLSGTPPRGSLDWRLRLTVSDTLKSVSDTMTLRTVTPDGTGSTGETDAAPAIHNGGLPNVIHATEDEHFSYTIPDGTYTDPDGDPLSYRFQYYRLIPVGGFPDYKIDQLLEYNYPNATYDATNQVIVDPESPTWLAFDEASLTLSGTPPTGDDWRLSLIVSDGVKSIGDATTLEVAAANGLAAATSDSAVPTDLTDGTDSTGTSDATDTTDDGVTVIEPTNTTDGTADTVDSPIAATTSSAPAETTATEDATAAATSAVKDDIAVTPNLRPRGESYPYPEIPASANREDYWYTYDAANREIVVNGVLHDPNDNGIGTIVVADDRETSYEQHYDTGGHVISRRYVVDGKNYLDRSYYTLQGQLQATYYVNPNSEDASEEALQGLAEMRRYNAAGQLIEIDRYANPAGDGDVTGRLVSETTFNYNADGQLRYQDHFGLAQGDSDYVHYRRIDPESLYSNALNTFAVTPSAIDIEPGGGGGGGTGTGTGTGQTYHRELSHLSRLAYVDNGGTYKLGYNEETGNLLGYTYKQFAKAADVDPDSTLPDTFTQTFRYGYIQRDSALVAGISGESDNENFKPSHTANVYDPFNRKIGRVKGHFGDDRQPPQVTSYAYGANGAIIQTEQGYLDPYGGYYTGNDDHPAKAPEHYYNAAGHHLGHLSENGAIDFNAAATGVQANAKAGQGSQRYTVQQGDTLRSIAQRVYGNAQLWYVIADANGLDGDSELTVGTDLTLPSKVSSLNNADTFHPYDAGQILGSDTPGLAYVPQTDNGCNTLATIIVIAVAVVVTIVTEGATAGYFASALGSEAGGAVAAGFVGGVAGSVASQEVGVALGVQDHFSLRQALTTGLTRAVTAGVGTYAAAGEDANAFQRAAHFLEGGQIEQEIARGAFNYATAYAANEITNQDFSFSWRALAAESLGYAAGREAGKAINANLPAPTNESEAFARRFVTAYAVAGATGEISHLINRGGTVDYARLAVNAFGTTVAQSLVQELSAPPRPEEPAEEVKAATPPPTPPATSPAPTAPPALDLELGSAALDEQAIKQQLKASVAAHRAELGASLTDVDLPPITIDGELPPLDFNISSEAVSDDASRMALQSLRLELGGSYFDVGRADKMLASVPVFYDDLGQGIDDYASHVHNRVALAGLAFLKEAVTFVGNLSSTVTNTGRIFTNEQVRSNFVHGVEQLISHPIETGVAVGEHISNMSLEDFGQAAALFLATGGEGAIIKLGRSTVFAGSLARDASGLAANYARRLGERYIGASSSARMFGSSAPLARQVGGALRTGGLFGERAPLTYDISNWAEYGLPSDGFFVRTLTPRQYRDLRAGRNFNFGGKPSEAYPGGMGFIGSAEEVRGIETALGYKEALKLNYDPKYLLEFQLKDLDGLQNVLDAPYDEFIPGGLSGAGFHEFNYPGIEFTDIVNPQVRVLK